MSPNYVTLSRPLSEPPAPPPKDTFSEPAPLTPPPKEGISKFPRDDCDQWIEHDVTSAPIMGLDPGEEKYLGYHEGKITSYNDEKIIRHNNTGKQVIIVDSYNPKVDASVPSENFASLGVSRRRIYFLRAVIAAIVVAIIIAGAVGGTIAARNKRKPPAIPAKLSEPTIPAKSTEPTIPNSPVRYANTGLAAAEWADLNGTLHKRLYYQDQDNKIRESSWDNSSAFHAAWNISTITDAVKTGTPIAAVAGYPHASYDYSLVKIVYYMATDEELTGRLAPSNGSQAWEDDNFSGLYSGSNNTFLAAYWRQNIQNTSEELVVIFQQQDFANGITQGRYTGNKTSSNPWVAQNFGFSQPQGSNFALALASLRRETHVMLYTIDDSSTLQQHEYVIIDTDLSPGIVVALLGSTGTDIKVDPQSPLAFVAQDNQPLFTTDRLPECSKGIPLTNLIFFPAPDAGSLVLKAWNCSTGFLDQTSEIEPLQKPNATFISLATLNDKVTGKGALYVMYDSGSGPFVEEWTVPLRAGEPWVTVRNVSIDVALT